MDGYRDYPPGWDDEEIDAQFDADNNADNDRAIREEMEKENDNI